MTLDEYIDFANTNPVCSVATLEDGQPRVRLIGLWFADETGFYFQTSTMKELPHQLRKNPAIELCFYHHEGLIGRMVRISGRAEFVNTPDMRARAMTDRPFLKTLGLSEDSPELVLFRLAHGKVHTWILESNLQEKQFLAF